MDPQALQREALDAIASASTIAELDDVRVRYLGRKSPLKLALREVRGRESGMALNAVREAVEQAVAERQAALERAELDRSIAEDRVDVTLPGTRHPRGHLHLVTQVRREVEDIFVGMGYRVVQGPEVEDDWHNFEALNMVPGHPARSMQDTLYLELGDPEQVMLRTHTSPVQIRTMETMKPPIFVVAPGRTYRNETLDARHSPVFHQIEGLAVDEGITLGDLLGTIEAFIQALFGADIHARFLPSFFPFTEPSVEFGMSCVFCRGAGCTVCSKTGWIELGGAGMVDPNVFTAVDIDPERYTGFAFGFGIDRVVQLLYGVDHVKNLWDGDVRFARQF